MPHSTEELKYRFLDACAEGNIEIANNCIARDVDINCCDNRDDVLYNAFNPTPALICAILLNQTEIVQLLLRNPKININVYDGVFHRPAILFALCTNNQIIVDELVNHKDFQIKREDFYLINYATKHTKITIPQKLLDQLNTIEDQIKDDAYDLMEDVPSEDANGIMYPTGDTQDNTENGDK